ncbi:MAG: DUF2179 domain-containing protein [Deltaproteobacteria bacterium]|nr:MAG: DUF2179 domain-containing protein [Deltaproteobacteria bacterium]
MPPEVLTTAVLIFLARIADVSFGTLRMVSVVRGRRLAAFGFGFVEVLIWVVAVSAVIQNLSEPLYAVVYALGFATGGVVGIMIEDRIAMGEQVVRVFSRKGRDIAEFLREEGYRVTVFEGEGLRGAVQLLYIKVPRRSVREAIRIARHQDRECFYVVEDVRATSTVAQSRSPVQRK